jgi:hypothetical protein
MNPRTSPLALLAALCAMSMASMGCTDAFTVHSIIEKPNEPGAPHGMHGLWVHQYDPDSYAVLQIARVANPERLCEVAELRVWEEPAALDDAPLLEGRACLAEVAGHTVVEIGTLTKPVLYLQYLVRLESAEFSVCTLQTVWGLSRDIARDDASQAELVGLDYTLREAEKYEQIFLISDQVKLRAYLEANLSRVVEKCDETDGHWEVFKRVTPELSPTADEPDKESGDESPAAPPLP